MRYTFIQCKRYTWAALLLIIVPAAYAQIVTEPPAERLPPQLADVSIEQKLNQQIPLDLSFHDESGAVVRLDQYFHFGKPVILSLVYYRCRMMCSEVLASLAHALRRLKFDPANQFEVLTISFDPKETSNDAKTAKQKYLEIYSRPGAERGWHFLTGDEPSITALAEAVGFHYRWDPASNQFAHATGIMLLTPEARIAQYYYGARYFPSDLRLGLIEASQNRIGTLADQVVLYCYHYDPRTGRYGAIVSRVIQVSGGVTVLFFGSILIFLFWTDPKRSRAAETPRIRPDTRVGPAARLIRGHRG